MAPLQWWVGNRDRVILGGFVVMLFAAIGIIPSPLQRELQAIREEHGKLFEISQVKCVNDAELVTDADKRVVQVRRCLTLKLNGE